MDQKNLKKQKKKIRRRKESPFIRKKKGLCELWVASWGSVTGAGAPRTCEEEGKGSVYSWRDWVCACLSDWNVLNVFFLVISWNIYQQLCAIFNASVLHRWSCGPGPLAIRNNVGLLACVWHTEFMVWPTHYFSLLGSRRLRCSFHHCKVDPDSNSHWSIKRLKASFFMPFIFYFYFYFFKWKLFFFSK